MNAQPFNLVYSEEFLQYSLGPNHPMRPQRLGPIISLMNYLYTEQDEFKIINPNVVDPSIIELAHTKEYIATLNKLSQPDFLPSHEERMSALTEFSIGTGDCPIFENMAEISELIVGSTVTAAEQLMNNKYNKAFVLLAGLHHASRNRASGFCYYNDVNVTIHRLKQLHPDIKILYLDTDLHAGDGVNYEFYNDPNTLTISIHESGEFLFPGTCFSNEVGSKEGEGYAVNLPFYPYTYDQLYQQAFEKYIPVFIEDFNPDIIIWQAGVDGHRDDPLGHLALTTNSYHKFGRLVDKMSESMDTPRVLALGGGGYNPSSVTRSWLAEVSGLVGKQLPKQLPVSWIEECRKLWQVEFPVVLHDEIESQNNTTEIIAGYNNAIDEFEKHISQFWSI